ncbi:LamG domain-containing protein [Segetibacter sp. 3557_3]|uniref:LamG domain-containing protein n=1 Tax=Segetibacter sp. 3557_3 TaxID=2547429 RepID=UPI001058F87B|nr:LamG domain-containing protein [Segetibacter sp. 3557_3]TDH23066.1 LamG domain-containing protein [Segetibacter sp. 3557_3]
MKSYIKFSQVFVGVLLMYLAGCSKPELDDDFTKGDPPPIAGGFVNSSEISPANLVAHFTFDGTIADAKNGVSGGKTSGNTSFVPGIKGQAYQGSSNGFIAYENPGPVATLTSFTVSLWINTAKHDGGAQGVFMLAKQDGSFWGNFFMMIEGNNSTDNKMLMKLHFEKNTAANIEHWIEPGGDLRADDMYNAWRHVAWTYDETTSKAGWFVSGQKRPLATGAEDRKADATNPLGALNFKSATRFIIGAFQNQLGAPFNAPESWMLPYTGKLDELRIYNKALSAQEISALSILERQGR